MTDWLNDSISDPHLRQSVEDVMKSYPATRGVIQRLVTYFENRPSEREGKRRKLESSELTKDEEAVRIVDVSFQLPARKKYDIIITKKQQPQFLLFNTKTNEVEHQIANLDFGCCVPSPDKKGTFIYTLFANNQDAIVFNTTDKGDMTIKEPPSQAERVISTDKHLVICDLLKQHARVEMSQPDNKAFKASGVSDTTGKLADKVHVNAYLKAKDGSLFFLPKGILFGFKKPTLFFPITSLSSIVITGVTQRTFDLTLILKKESVVFGSGTAFKPTKEGDDDTVQFSMISQSEYGGIDSYIKQANINDNSMAEERKAPAVTVNNNSKKESKDGDENNNNNNNNNGDEDEDSEDDGDFEPSDDDNDPLEYDTDPESDDDDDENAEEEEETERDLEAEEQHNLQDAEMEEDEEDDDEEGGEEDEVDLLDESD